MHIVYILSLLAATICNSIVIVILLRRSEKSLAMVAFIVLLLLINIWAVPQLFINILNIKKELFVQVDKISALGYTFIPIPFFIFALAFTNRLSLLKNYFVIFIIFIVPLFFLFIAWNTSLIEVRDYTKVLPADWGYPVPTGSMFKYFILWFDSIMIFSLVLIINLYRTTLDLQKKKQAFWLMIAVIVPLAFGTVTNGILPALQIHMFPSAIPLTSIMALIVAYAIFRHELFEATPQTILSSIGNGMIIVDKEGKIIHSNPAALNLFGLRKNILANKNFFNVITLRKKINHADAVEDKKPLVNLLQNGGHLESSDLFMSLHGKKQIPVECSITPIIQDRKIKGATLIFRDITKEKELDEIKNQFIGIASHELKTPLTSIKAFGQLLEAKLLQEKDKQNRYFITNINKQVDKIMVLISDLLDMNRIDIGKYVLNKKKCDVYALVVKTVKDLQVTTATHTIQIDGKLTKELMIDKERIEQVLINLLTNAIKYSPNADRVGVHLSETKRGLNISVQDFGIGIPNKDEKKIFGRFYRTQISLERNITGFGLGLSICMENIHRHNGKIWVKSKVGKGSTFSFTLPITGK